MLAPSNKTNFSNEIDLVSFLMKLHIQRAEKSNLLKIILSLRKLLDFMAIIFLLAAIEDDNKTNGKVR